MPWGSLFDRMGKTNGGSDHMALCKRNLVLTDEEIINIILKYIDENIYNYAVMIDGEWGCGKTYFVREALSQQ